MNLSCDVHIHALTTSQHLSLHVWIIYSWYSSKADFVWPESYQPTSDCRTFKWSLVISLFKVPIWQIGRGGSGSGKQERISPGHLVKCLLMLRKLLRILGMMIWSLRSKKAVQCIYTPHINTVYIYTRRWGKVVIHTCLWFCLVPYSLQSFPVHLIRSYHHTKRKEGQGDHSYFTKEGARIQGSERHHSRPPWNWAPDQDSDLGFLVPDLMLCCWFCNCVPISGRVATAFQSFSTCTHNRSPVCFAAWLFIYWTRCSICHAYWGNESNLKHRRKQTPWRRLTGNPDWPPMRWQRPNVWHVTSQRLCSVPRHLLLVIAVMWVTIVFIWERCSQAKAAETGTEGSVSWLESCRSLRRMTVRALLRNAFYPLTKTVFCNFLIFFSRNSDFFFFKTCKTC